MRYMVERNFVQILGHIWWPPSAVCAQERDLTPYDLENIGEFTRDNVSSWLTKNAGDFSEIIDFFATAGDTDIPWSSEENELKYLDCIGGPE